MKTDDLKFICPSIKEPEYWASLMEGVLESYEINTVNRKAMFLAQCLHESGGFKFLKEIWGPTAWQIKYEGHKGLGNTQPGDGKKFMGRGLIQLTGRANYQAFSDWIKMPDVMNHPEQVEEKSMALLSAIWFWSKNNLNKFADSDNIEGCTKAVNGSKMLGLEERKQYYERGKKILGVSI